MALPHDGGVDFVTVKELLGHKTLAMTLGYSHLSPAHKTRAVNLLDEAPSFGYSFLKKLR